MASVTARKQLQQEVQALPEELAAQVLDFVQFLKDRREEEAFLWRQVQEAQAYRQEHLEETVTVTAEEWLSSADQYNQLGLGRSSGSDDE